MVSQCIAAKVRPQSPAPDACTLELLAENQAAAWNAYVQRQPRASVYHRYEWRNLIKDLFGHETYMWCARGDDAVIRGVLPLVRLKSHLFGDYMVSMPYFNYGGAVADTQAVEEELMREAGAHAHELGCASVEFRDTCVRSLDWPVRCDKVVMELDLPETPEQLWKRIGSKLRAQIKRPQREGVDVKLGGSELLPDFYRVFSRNMRDLGTPVYPRSFFAAILETFATQAYLVSVYYRGRPVAAAFLLGQGERLEIPWASSLREYNRLGVNMLLYWEALRSAIEAGYRWFDFGRSSADSGTYRFKRQWGARPAQLHWHYALAPGAEPPNLSPSNPRYQLAIGAWKRLPLPVANWLGPQLVKNLP